MFAWITTLAGTLDARQQTRFVKLCGGLLFARGRRTVASWLRACVAGRDYKRYYYLLGSVGRISSTFFLTPSMIERVDTPPDFSTTMSTERLPST